MPSDGELGIETPADRHGEAAAGSVVRALALGQVRLFDEDAGLRGLLPELSAAEARTAKQVLATAWRLGRGSWDPEGNPPLDESVAELLLLDGLLLSCVDVGPRHSVEFLGSGDLFRAEPLDTHGYATVPSERTWRVLLPARIAALEREVAVGICTVPGAAGELQHRWVVRVRSLAVRLAIAQVPHLTTRLHLVLWHLADRWGRRCADGTVIPFRLTQQVLAECASAQRTSVTAALHALRERGIVERNEQGHWVLRAEPPGEFT